MKSVRYVAVALLAFSSASFSATEITQNQTSGMKSLGSISVIHNMDESSHSDISHMADAKGAGYYVITSSGSIGNGSNSVVIANLFSGKK